VSQSVDHSELGKKQKLLEMAVFLFLITPSLLFSFFVVTQGSLNFVLTAVSTILRDLALVCLILFLVWRNGEPLLSIGWTFTGWWREAILGLVLFGPLFSSAAMVETGLHQLGLSAPKTPWPSLVPGRNIAQSVLALVLVAIVALAEETIFRGYLILRLRAVTGSSAAAVLLSAVIFSFGHGYEGSAGVVTVGLMGLVFGLVYVWRGSLVAPIVMHFLQDFVAIVLIPLLRSH
jgi:membrane protease YdiL (CAAX protease family)